MSTPVVTYQSSTFLDCKPSGQPRKKFTLPQHSPFQYSCYSIDQDYAQRIDQFPPAPKNTISTALGLSDANAILTVLSQPKSEGTLGRFVATFSRVPQSWVDFKMIPFTFPGFPGIIGEGGRDIFADVVPARIQYDYFVLDPANVISSCAAGTPQPAASILDSGGGNVTCVYQLGDIPTIQRTFFVVANGGTPDYSNRTNSITPIGGIVVNTVTWWQSLPSKANYQTWISNAKTNGWQSTVWNGTTDTGGTIGQIVAEDSQIQPYLGNIMQRATIYVLAK